MTFRIISVRDSQLPTYNRHTTDNTMFEIEAFLRDHFPDPDAVVGLLNAWRLPAPKIEAVRKWFPRKSVPAEWLPLLIAVLELENGSPISLTRYVRGAQGHENAQTA